MNGSARVEETMHLERGDDALSSVGSQGPGGSYVEIPGVWVPPSARLSSSSLPMTSRGTLASSCLWGPHSVLAVV